MMTTLLVCLSLVSADDPKATKENPPPLTAEQVTQVRALVQQTQADHTAARQSLTEAQEDLARCYAKYELDEKEVARLQAVIVEQQQKLLASHHRMQKELRSIVGAERFLILSRRIDNLLKNPAAVSPSPASPPK